MYIRTYVHTYICICIGAQENAHTFNLIWTKYMKGIHIYICIYKCINVYTCMYIFIYIGVQEDVDTLCKPFNLDEEHKCSSMCDTTNTAQQFSLFVTWQVLPFH